MATKNRERLVCRSLHEIQPLMIMSVNFHVYDMNGTNTLGVIIIRIVHRGLLTHFMGSLFSFGELLTSLLFFTILNVIAFGY